MFPAEWPQPCPPEGTVYRIVRDRELKAADFLSAAEEGTFRSKDSCQRQGLSVFREWAEVVTHAGTYRRLGRFIAVGALTPEHGSIKLTPASQPSHTTWWPPAEFDRRLPFTEVEALQ
jgi:hypothetical protein